MTTPDPAVTRLRQLDACAVSDALDRCGIDGALLGITPRSVVGRRIAGRVSTVQVVERTDDTPRPHLGSRAIEAGDADTVIVVANGGRTDVSSWGGILSHAALAAGIAGVVVDGACRDVDEARELGFPVFARGTVPVTARGRVVEAATDVPVEIDGLRVAPGDYLVADGSGVVRCPAEHLDRVLEIAEDIAAREARMVEAVGRGVPITEVMHDRAFDAAR
ncbi:4-carboxy-4-hydroxy-2-oxoadipate aldolase/oxaloacetate decarboxylase [Nitriliruptoraceae bacterium ZYF776]|nr:4-carboxy-4-hydroxy-2-oxoadipate aldolase/oxaloacetate decarboxylase [Profundirhabdus halotolerans]